MTTPSQTEQANIEKVRATIDAFNRRDREAMLALGDDHFEYDWTRSRGPNARVYRGRGELMEFIEDQWSIFEDQHLDVHQYIPRGNHVVVTATVHGRGRQGVPGRATSAHLYTFAEDGRLARITLFRNVQRRWPRQDERMVWSADDLLLVRREQCAAAYCRLSLKPVDGRGTALSCCALLRFAASTALPHGCSCFHAKVAVVSRLAAPPGVSPPR